MTCGLDNIPIMKDKRNVYPFMEGGLMADGVRFLFRNCVKVCRMTRKPERSCGFVSPAKTFCRHRSRVHQGDQVIP